MLHSNSTGFKSFETDDINLASYIIEVKGIDESRFEKRGNRVWFMFNEIADSEGKRYKIEYKRTIFNRIDSTRMRLIKITKAYNTEDLRCQL